MAYAPMFEHWTVEEDELVYDVVLDLGHGEDYPLSGHPWFYGVRIPMAKAGGDGRPDETERARLDAVENRIRGVMKQREAVYVGRRTGDRNRDLLFYVPARPRGIDDRIRQSIGMEILFMSRPDPDWVGYESLLPGEQQWRQIEDRKVIAGLLNMDANPNATHQVLHVVTTASPKGAKALEKFFTVLELDDITIEGAKPDIRVTGVQVTALDVDEIHRVSWMLESRAPKVKGSYEGWSADPVDTPDAEEELFDDDSSGLEALLAALGGGGDD